MEDLRYWTLLAEFPGSRLLFTTRAAAIASAVGARKHVAERLTEAQSRRVLARWAGQEENQLPSETMDLMVNVGGGLGASPPRGSPWDHHESRHPLHTPSPPPPSP